MLAAEAFSFKPAPQYTARSHILGVLDSSTGTVEPRSIVLHPFRKIKEPVDRTCIDCERTAKLTVSHMMLQTCELLLHTITFLFARK